VIDRAPEIVLDAVDLYKDLFQVPLPLSALMHIRGAFRSGLSGEDRSKTINPQSHALVANIDPTLMQQVFAVPQR
jgi:hypothetical protein